MLRKEALLCLSSVLLGELLTGPGIGAPSPLRSVMPLLLTAHILPAQWGKLRLGIACGHSLCSLTLLGKGCWQGAPGLRLPFCVHGRSLLRRAGFIPMPVKRPKHRGLSQNSSCTRSHARSPACIVSSSVHSHPSAEILNPVLHRKNQISRGKPLTPSQPSRKAINGGAGLYLRCVPRFLIP